MKCLYLPGKSPCFLPLSLFLLLLLLERQREAVTHTCLWDCKLHLGPRITNDIAAGIVSGMWVGVGDIELAGILPPSLPQILHELFKTYKKFFSYSPLCDFGDQESHAHFGCGAQRLGCGAHGAHAVLSQCGLGCRLWGGACTHACQQRAVVS